VVSGHTLKHLLAVAACFWLVPRSVPTPAELSSLGAALDPAPLASDSAARVRG